MIKQTRFYLGLMLIVQSISCFFLVICYLFKDKKNTAGPFTALGILSAVAGGFLIAEKVKERFEEELILEAMSEICHAVEIPVVAIVLIVFVVIQGGYQILKVANLPRINYLEIRQSIAEAIQSLMATE
jgi:hypothetical protein